MIGWLVGVGIIAAIGGSIRPWLGIVAAIGFTIYYVTKGAQA